MPNVMDLNWMPGRWSRLKDVAREGDIWWVCFPCQDAMEATDAHGLQLNDWRQDHDYCECRTLDNWVEWATFVQIVTRDFHVIDGYQLGQSLLDHLHRVHRPLARKIRATALDPSHFNSRIPAFLAFVDENWETV